MIFNIFSLRKTILFGVHPQVPTLQQDATDIMNCILQFKNEYGYSTPFPKVRISQYSAMQLRKDKHRKEAALNYLIQTNQIRYESIHNDSTVYLNFPVNTAVLLPHNSRV